MSFLGHSRTNTTVYTVGGRAHQKQADCCQTETSIIAMSLELGTRSGRGKIKAEGGAKQTHHVPPAPKARGPELPKQCSGAPSERCKVLFPSAQLSPSLHHEQTLQVASVLMSHSHSTASASNNFQLIINNALKAYEKRTKQDLLAHPLASQLQTCDSPAAILAILHQQVKGLDQSRSSDDRLTIWLDPTINVLYTLSATLGDGVGLVSLGYELV